MTEETRPETQDEYRSASKVAIDLLTASGVAAGGTGTLLLGVASAKQVFGGGDKSEPSSASPGPEQPKRTEGASRVGTLGRVLCRLAYIARERFDGRTVQPRA